MTEEAHELMRMHHAELDRMRPIGRTESELEALKADWLADPCWDVEKTEGFEAHEHELYVFRVDREREWRLSRRDELRRLADRLGCPGNVRLAGYVERLEDRLKDLERRLERTEER